MTLRRTRALPAQQRGDGAAALAAAVTLLAARDFAPRELQAKLTSRGFEAAAAQAAIEELTARGALNEARYAENYVTWHANRGQGPVRIAAELRRQGIPEALIEPALTRGPDWPALARKLCRAKFGPAVPGNWREKARQMRFLQYRGFSSDHIRAATGADPDWTEGP
ncbi:MAG TPA: regulatory protein RecX [Steroidobacteraceae bacterium]|nr:regulatory protein RecX [Steroidobacteraceae bacterium]